MFNFKYLRIFLLVILSAFALTTSNVCTEKVVAQPAPVAMQSAVVKTDNADKPLDIVKNPTAYLNKAVRMNARFDKFATLGLDYKSAMRSSEEYISFLIYRDDTKNDIPLSEMKLFLKRDMAEKHIDLKTNDKIFITGKVFSDALGDAWIDVVDLYITQKAPEKDGVK